MVIRTTPVYKNISYILQNVYTQKIKNQTKQRLLDFATARLNSWPTFSPYLYNGVYSELTSCNSLLHDRNLDAQLCRDLNPAARDIVDKHVSTRPREYYKML